MAWSVALAALVSLALASAATAQPSPDALQKESCRAQAASGVPAPVRAALARGFNLTGWVDGAVSRRPDLNVLRDLHRRGFTHIRLPVGAEYLLDAFSPADAVVRRFEELDRALTSLIVIGYVVSLDLHPSGVLSSLHAKQPEQTALILNELWGRLARRYADRPADRLLFEVLNEPAVDARTWQTQGPRLVDTIRRAAPRHTIVYGPANFQRIDALAKLAPLADANIVYAVHFYDPMTFTHQGQSWSDDPLRHLDGVPFPADMTHPGIAFLLRRLDREGQAGAADMVRRELREPWTTERLSASIAQAAAWARQHRQTVILNEFGVLAGKAPAADRLRWLSTITRSAEAHCIGWTHWEYADAFGFVRRTGDFEAPDARVIDALLGPKS